MCESIHIDKAYKAFSQQHPRPRTSEHQARNNGDTK